MFRGSCVALVTPMTQTGALDKAAFRSLVEWHLVQGSDALVVGGTTGESATLTNSELREMLEIALVIVKNIIPVIAGTGSNSTEKTIEQTQQAKALGCDGALIVTPYYNKPTQEGLYLHYKKIAETVDLPIILYNVPGRTGVDLLPQTVARLSQIPNIIGIKDATGDLKRMESYLKEAKSGFKLYSGDDGTALEFMRLGGQGVISVAANVAPRALHDLCCAVFEKDLNKAENLDNNLKKLYKYLFIESNPIPVKWTLSQMGLISQGIRLPLTVLSEAHQGVLRGVLEELKALGLLNLSGEVDEKINRA